MPLRLQSAFGLVAMIALAWLLSSHKRRLPVRAIVGGLALQFAFALIVLKTEPGLAAFDAAGRVVNAVLLCAREGTEFVFGANPAAMRDAAPDAPPESIPHASDLYPFAFWVLPSIIFFSSLAAVLHYWRVIPAVVRAAGAVMRVVMGTSGAESLCAAANIFVGQSEAPLVVRPYLERMTPSELTSVMVAGFATVAGGVMAVYVGLGIDAGHLITASVISAPAALLIAKVMQPEVDAPETAGGARVVIPAEGANTLDAAAGGAADGLRLALNVGAQIVAFLGLIALANLILGEASGLLGRRWTIEELLGYAGWPFAWLLGVEPADCYEVGQLVGIKTVANEVIAYDRLAKLGGEAISDRSRVLATYALCGFANFGSIGIQLGGLSLLAPGKRPVLARLALRAMIGGTLAAFMTACVAGILT